MDENRNFALVPRPLGAVAKAEPGAKRILSGMVADTLALVRRELDVTPLTLSVEGGDGKVIAVIERNTIIPARASLVLPDSSGKETTIGFNVLQGEHPVAAKNHCLCKCIIEGVELSADDKPRIEVAFDIDANGILHISAKNIRTGKQQSIRINNVRGLSKNEIDQLRLEAQEQKLPAPSVRSAAQMESCFQTGEKYYYGQGVPTDHAEAVKWYRKAAERGHASAQHTLGRCYAFGQGVEQNRTEMLAWYRRAADGGHPVAQWSLGRHYHRGDGVPKDDSEAAKWYRKSAEQGYVVAQELLGHCYAAGRGVPQDFTEAAEWYRRAASAGYLGGILSLAKCQIEGRGLAKNSVEAIKVFKALAQEGNPTARYNLGLCYLHGKGVQRNPDEACKWFAHASLQGLEAASTELKLLIAGNEISEGTRRLYEKTAKREQPRGA